MSKIDGCCRYAGTLRRWAGCGPPGHAGDCIRRRASCRSVFPRTVERRPREKAGCLHLWPWLCPWLRDVRGGNDGNHADCIAHTGRAGEADGHGLARNPCRLHAGREANWNHDAVSAPRTSNHELQTPLSFCTTTSGIPPLVTAWMCSSTPVDSSG